MVVQPPSSSLRLQSCVSSRNSTAAPAHATESPPGRDSSIMARFRQHQHKKSARSIVSEDPWKVDTPFGPPRISHFPGGGIRRIRNTLSKLSPSARAERELLKQKNRYKIPLTERNMDTFVTEQAYARACHPERYSNDLQVAAWLDRLSVS